MLSFLAALFPSNRQILAAITELKDTITVNEAQTLEFLSGIQSNLTEATAEILAKIADLENAQSQAGSTTPAIDAALVNLKAMAQRLADIVPGTAPEPAPAPPAEAPAEAPAAPTGDA